MLILFSFKSEFSYNPDLVGQRCRGDWGLARSFTLEYLPQMDGHHRQSHQRRVSCVSSCLLMVDSKFNPNSFVKWELPPAQWFSISWNRDVWWATRPSFHSFACTALSALLASLARSVALSFSLAYSPTCTSPVFKVSFQSANWIQWCIVSVI